MKVLIFDLIFPKINIFLYKGTIILHNASLVGLLVLHRADRGMPPDMDGTGEIKYPGRTKTNKVSVFREAAFNSVSVLQVRSC